MAFQEVQGCLVVKESEEHQERKEREDLQAWESEDREDLLDHLALRVSPEQALQVHPALQASAVLLVATVLPVYVDHPVHLDTVTPPCVSVCNITDRVTEVHKLSKPLVAAYTLKS